MYTASFQGNIAKSVMINCNDPDNSYIALPIKARVKRMVTILPVETPTWNLNDTGPTTQELSIRVEQKERIEFQSVTCGAPYVSAEVDPKSLETATGREYRIRVSFDPSTPAGRNVIILTAQTTFQRQPQISINVIYEKGILVVPQSVYLGAIGTVQAIPITQTIMLSRSSGSFHITKADCDDANLQIRTETIKDGQIYRIHIAYKGGWAPGSEKHKLTVLTDDPAQPKIDIPITANVLPPAKVSIK